MCPSLHLWPAAKLKIVQLVKCLTRMFLVRIYSLCVQNAVFVRESPFGCTSFVLFVFKEAEYRVVSRNCRHSGFHSKSPSSHHSYLVNMFAKQSVQQLQRVYLPL
jgi:hypothetical protein